MSEPKKRKPKPFILEQTIKPDSTQYMAVSQADGVPCRFESTATAIKYATDTLTGKVRVIQVCDEFTVAVKTIEKRIVTR